MKAIHRSPRTSPGRSTRRYGQPPEVGEGEARASSSASWAVPCWTWVGYVGIRVRAILSHPVTSLTSCEAVRTRWYVIRSEKTHHLWLH